MRAATYLSANELSLTDKAKPQVIKPTDAVVRLVKTTICGTDLHILGGDVPACKPGTTLGHEGIGIVEEVGSAVNHFKVGDKVIISCVTACNTCYYCKHQLPSHCEDGGWILGHLIEGTQAEYVQQMVAFIMHLKVFVTMHWLCYLIFYQLHTKSASYLLTLNQVILFVL